jgi:hypothetical protein
VLEVTKEDAIDWWRTHVVADKGRKKMIVCVDATNRGEGGGEDDEEEEEEEEGGRSSSSGSGSEESDDEDMKEDEEEEVGMEFPSSGDMEEDWWRTAYPVVELATTDITSFKATLALLAAPVPVPLR